MKSWQGRSCRKEIRRLEIERSGSVEGRAIGQDGRLLPPGCLPRLLSEIDAELTTWRSRLAGPEPKAAPVLWETCPPCRACGRKLRPTFEMVSVRVETKEGHHTILEPGELKGFGYNALGHFCTLRCGWRFAVDSLESGV